MQQPIQFLVTRHPNGNVEVGVSVPEVLGDKLFCYGVFECAKDAIREYKPGAVNGLILPGPLDSINLRPAKEKP